MSISGYDLPKVAILLASYQGKDWIAEQLNSILYQQKVLVKLTIADDVSTDGTLQWLNENQSTFDFRILSTKRTGSAAANFFRLLKETDLTEVDYVALSDQDDIWHPEKLARAISAMKSDGYDAYSSNVLAFWSDGRRKLIDKAQPQTALDFLFESAGPGCTFVLSQKLALDLKTFLRTHAKAIQKITLHDWLIYAFARARGYRWYIDPVASMQYRQHDRNIVGANTGLPAMVTRWRKLRDGWYRAQILAIASLLDLHNVTSMQQLSRLNLLDRLSLAMHANQFRRRRRDRWAMVVFMLFLAKK